MKKLFKLAPIFIRKQFLVEFNYKFNFIIQFVGIPISILSFYFFSKIIDGSSVYMEGQVNYVTYAVVGVACLDLSTNILNHLTRMVREEQISGVLQEIINSNISYEKYFFLNSLYPFLTSLIRIFIYFIILYSFKLASFGLINLLLVFMALIMLGASMVGIGLIACSLILLFKRGNFVTSIYITLCGLFGGIVYPISVLPQFLQSFSNILPTYHLANSIRSLLHDVKDYIDYFNSFYMLLLLTIVINFLSIFLIKNTILFIKHNRSFADF